VAITDPTGAQFEETSSREGLIETEAFWEVREIMSRVLEAAVRRIESARGKGRKKPEKQDPSSGSRAAKETEDAIADVERVIDGLSDGGGSLDPDHRDTVEQALVRLSAAARIAAGAARERDDLLKELNLLRILASMGLAIAEFTHDFSHLAETMQLNINAIERHAGAPNEAFAKAIDRLRDQFGQVRAYTAHFGSMMASNASRDLRPIDLYAFSKAFVEDLQAMFEKRGLELVVERPVEYDIRTTAMHPSEWSSILLNLLTNSLKAVQRASRRGCLLIRVGSAGPNTVFLEFSDNGDGIPPENREHVFDAFFTTSGGAPVRASESAQALGTGLGLKIVADIAQAVGGEASIIDPPDGYTTCVRIVVPAYSGADASA
jgi:signal transduction histidine kinase